MLKNIGLFCKRDLQKRPIFCKETCIFKHPTNRSHPIPKTMGQWHDENNASLIYMDQERKRKAFTHVYLDTAFYKLFMRWLIYLRQWLHYFYPCIETMGHRYTQDNASVTSYTWRDAFIYMTWRIHIHDMHSYTWHDSSIYVTRLLHVDAMTPSYRYGVATISRLFKMIGLFAEYENMGFFCRALLHGVRINESCHVYGRVMS